MTEGQVTLETSGESDAIILVPGNDLAIHWNEIIPATCVKRGRNVPGTKLFPVVPVISGIRVGILSGRLASLIATIRTNELPIPDDDVEIHQTQFNALIQDNVKEHGEIGFRHCMECPTKVLN